jgi:hypothetical protein
LIYSKKKSKRERVAMANLCHQQQQQQCHDADNNMTILMMTLILPTMRITPTRTTTRNTTGGGGWQGHDERWRRARQEAERLRQELLLQPARANKRAVQ